MSPTKPCAWLSVAAFTLFCGLAFAAPRNKAYVILSGQAVSVDLITGRVLKRTEFPFSVGMAEHAKLIGNKVLVAGDLSRKGAAGIQVDLATMEVKRRSTLEPECPNHSRDEYVFPQPPDTIKVARTRERGDGLHLTFQDLSGRIADLVVDQHPEASPYESLDIWTLTADGKKLLVLSSGGFKYQSYLRVYNYPSLRLSTTTPLLRIRDHVPVALYAM